MSCLKLFLLLCCLLALQTVACAADTFARAIELFKKQAYADALKLFNEARSPERESQRLYYCALCYLHTSRIQEGRGLLQKICKNFPGSEAAAIADKYLKTAPALPQPGQPASIPPKETVARPFSSREISIPFRRTAGGQLIVVAELGGRSMNMIFDTGAEECLFGRNQIAAAGLANAEHSRMATLNSVAGPLAVFRLNAEIKLGAIQKNLAVCAQEKDMETGILGQPFLAGYNCVVDNQAGVIRLRQSGSESGAASVDSFAVPFSLDGDKIIVSAQVNGRQSDMCFDTGSFGVCVSKEQCPKLGLKVPETPAERRRGPNGQQVSCWHINADLALGPIKKYDFPVRVIDCQISYPLLGQTFFGNRTYSIDRDRKEIRFVR